MCMWKRKCIFSSQPFSMKLFPDRQFINHLCIAANSKVSANFAERHNGSNNRDHNLGQFSMSPPEGPAIDACGIHL